MDEEKIERNKKKLFDRLRKLNSMTSEEKLKELEGLFMQKSEVEGKDKLPSGFCLTGIEILMDRLIEVYNDTSDQMNCPFKYAKVKIGRHEK
jgi:hypothetical protein